MFTLSEIEIIMRKRREEMISLLRDLGFSKAGQNWQEEIDSFITEKIRSLMKSASVLEGYLFLLRAAEIPQSYSETEKDKLAKIAANRAEIERRIIKRAGSAVRKYETRFKFDVVQAIKTQLDSLRTNRNKLEKSAKDLNYLKTYYMMESERKEFIALFHGLMSDIDELQEDLYSTEEQQKSLTEDEFISFMNHSLDGDTFLVSVSRERVPARPDPSEQYRKFTEEEARYMLDILERLNDIVSGI